jgi:hypothetical protein
MSTRSNKILNYIFFFICQTLGRKKNHHKIAAALVFNLIGTPIEMFELGNDNLFQNIDTFQNVLPSFLILLSCPSDDCFLMHGHAILLHCPMHLPWEWKRKTERQKDRQTARESERPVSEALKTISKNKLLAQPWKTTTEK